MPDAHGGIIANESYCYTNTAHICNDFIVSILYSARARAHLIFYTIARVYCMSHINVSHISLYLSLNASLKPFLTSQENNDFFK